MNTDLLLRYQAALEGVEVRRTCAGDIPIDVNGIDMLDRALSQRDDEIARLLRHVDRIAAEAWREGRRADEMQIRLKSLLRRNESLKRRLAEVRRPLAVPAGATVVIYAGAPPADPAAAGQEVELRRPNHADFDLDPDGFENAVRAFNASGVTMADVTATFRAIWGADRRPALEAIERVEAEGNPQLTVRALRQVLTEMIPDAVGYLAGQRGCRPLEYLAAVGRGEVPTAEALALLRARYVDRPAP